MTTSGREGHIRTTQYRRDVAVGALALAIVLLGLGGAAAHNAAGPATGPVTPPPAENVTVQATSGLAFVPNQLTVAPGALVHLVVVQAASFPHTFVLSPVANATIPTSDTPTQLYEYFNAHPPLVNLSLPGTPGARAYANFTAPPLGSYEFVCEIPSHFQAGMYGELVSTTQGPSGSPGFPLTLAIGAGVGVVIVVAVVLAVTMVRRRRTGPPPNSS